MAHEIEVTRGPDCGPQVVLTIPSGKLSAGIVADEVRRACQRAYDLGRQDWHETVERKMTDTLRLMKPPRAA